MSLAPKCIKTKNQTYYKMTKKLSKNRLFLLFMTGKENTLKKIKIKKKSL